MKSGCPSLFRQFSHFKSAIAIEMTQMLCDIRRHLIVGFQLTLHLHLLLEIACMLRNMFLRTYQLVRTYILEVFGPALSNL